MPLINYEVTFQLTCSKNSILAAGIVASQVPKFRITDTKLYVPAAAFSTQGNVRLLKQ